MNSFPLDEHAGAHLDAIRRSYDTVAADYARFVKDPGALDPVSRAVLAAFAELVASSGLGPTADVGCGPGKVTAYLTGLGVHAFGVDLSPRMIELARAAHPELRFEVGPMSALAAGDGELGGVLAFYSTHHLPPAELPQAYAEFHRALAPGGHLLLVTRVGEEEHQRRTYGYGDGDPAPFDSYRLPADRIAELLERAGFAITAQTLQAPEEGAKRPVAGFLARKPATGTAS
ncbi:methyltransferase [Streptomyces rubiginosohelvolus]|uniref:class I SAM-dependent methyltransferase n=1 Tax=Streptomyces TaxID=1883 RepID=UPI0004C8C0F1|nr:MULTISPECIES: class I SAM-dependent methyltransferase [Streptomyces]WST53909.1 class I SAM-dependent methyltransferase [Streptomyces rubiginosohelvolus]GGS10331.1 methyltransferase [Streptomyces rubiginosohelvolus]